MSQQLQLALPRTCRHRGCARPVVGASITGDGHVCRGHNEADWAHGLRVAGDHALAADIDTASRLSLHRQGPANTRP
jgi:hypothetical protein